MSRFLLLAVAMSIAAALSTADVARAASAAGADGTDASSLDAIVVSAQRLDDARSHIQTQIGATTYTFDASAIAALPAGENTELNQVILQAPEVAQDSFGQFHIRGEHNGLQYRVNGIILPEGISVFGQSLDARFLSSLSLIDGALPAEYGLRTAGIIDITTKSGLQSPGGSVSIYGGSHSTIEPGLVYGGGAGNLSYLVAADFVSNDLGIESPDGSSNPIHDHTTQYHAFGYFEDILDDHNRLALMLGSAVGNFQIPNVAGAQPVFTVDGGEGFQSADLNENQREVTQFGALSWQHSTDAFDAQTSFIARYSSLHFTPDPIGDIVFTGIAQDAYKQNIAYAAQTDEAFHVNAEHTIRAGAFVQSDHSISQTSSDVLLATTPPGDPDPMYETAPTTIVDNGSATEWLESVYLQDEWKIVSNFTLNYGLRFDDFSAYTSGHQLSPRINAVWQVVPDTTLHAGYARYFSPPPFELVGEKDISLFVNTSYPPLTLQADPPLPESANYYDIGVQRQFTHAFKMGLDAYYKQSQNLIDEGQFGAPIILTPFNYRYGKQYGAELTASYSVKNLSAYLNLAVQSAKGKQIDSAQYNFSQTDLDYIANNYIHLDHEQQHTASGGVSYFWSDNRVGADFLYGSGLRADLELPPGETNGYGGTDIPNGQHLPYYTQINLGASHIFHLTNAGTLTARFDLINVLDAEYQIRNGTGVGVGAPQYGPRRGVFLGLTKSLGGS